MSWIKRRGSGGRKKKTSGRRGAAAAADEKPAPVNPRLKLARAMEKQRSDMQELEKRIPEFQSKIAGLEQTISACGTNRARIRERRRCEREIADLRRLITSVRSGAMERDFRRKITPYLRALSQAREKANEDPSEKSEEASAAQEGPAAKRRRIAATRVHRTTSGRAKRKVPTSKRAMRIKSSSKTDSGHYREATIVDEFNSQFLDTAPPLYIVSGDVCPHCGEGQQRRITKTSQLACSKCGVECPYVDMSSKSLGWGQEVEYQQFSYKRQTHFNELLASFQAKESTQIAPHTMERICEQLWRENVSIDDITPKKIRSVLKKLGLRKYYENTTAIACELTGTEPPRLSSAEEQQMRAMFLAIQQPFQKHCPPERKNFLSYHYVLFKFAQLMSGMDEYLPLFSLLKGKEKLQRQDEIFEKICHELEWEFIPSL